MVQELTLEHYGFSDADLDKTFSFTEDNNMPGIFGDGQSRTLRQIRDELDRYYCKSYTVEFMHCHEDVEREWMINRVRLQVWVLQSTNWLIDREIDPSAH